MDSIFASTGLGISGIFSTLVENLPKILAAIFVMVVGFYLAKIAVRLTKWGVQKRGAAKRPSAVRLFVRTVRGIILIIAVLIALMILGVDFTATLAGLALSSVVLGILLAPVITSFLYGLFVVSDQPYEVGDLVEIVGSDIVGYVDEIGWRTTKIKTVDNRVLTISNSNILNKEILNYTAGDLRLRSDIPVTITYDSDVDKAIEILEKIPTTIGGVIQEDVEIHIYGRHKKRTRPHVLITGLDDKGVHMILRVWLYHPYTRRRIMSIIYHDILKEFKKNKIKFTEALLVTMTDKHYK